MKVREILPNYNQRKEEIAREKISGSDLRDDLSQEFWAWEDENEEDEGCCSSFVAKFRNEIRANPYLREEGRKKDKFALK